MTIQEKARQAARSMKTYEGLDQVADVVAKKMLREVLTLDYSTGEGMRMQVERWLAEFSPSLRPEPAAPETPRCRWDGCTNAPVLCREHQVMAPETPEPPRLQELERLAHNAKLQGFTRDEAALRDAIASISASESRPTTAPAPSDVEQAKDELRAYFFDGDWEAGGETALEAYAAAVRQESAERHAETVIAFEGDGIDPGDVSDGFSYSADVVRQKIARVRAESAAEIERLKEELETERMRLAACSTAALGNTRSSVSQRITPGHPHYSASYGDVCRAVDAEIACRERAEAALVSRPSDVEPVQAPEGRTLKTPMQRVIEAGWHGLRGDADAYEGGSVDGYLAAAREGLTIFDEIVTSKFTPSLNTGTAMDALILTALAMRELRAQLDPLAAERDLASLRAEQKEQKQMMKDDARYDQSATAESDLRAGDRSVATHPEDVDCDVCGRAVCMCGKCPKTRDYCVRDCVPFDCVLWEE